MSQAQSGLNVRRVIAVGSTAIGLALAPVEASAKLKVKVPKPPKIGGSIGKALGNVQREAGKGLSHVAKEVGNGVQNTGEAVVVVAKTTERTVDGVGKSLEKSAHLIGDGKLLKAGEELTVGQAKLGKDLTVKAMQESSFIRGGVILTAGAFSGGAAPLVVGAITAAYTYETTGKLNTALRAGLIGGAATYAAGAATKFVPASTGIAGKVAAGAAVGAGAAAAAGGDARMIRDGALIGGVLAGAQEVMRSPREVSSQPTHNAKPIASTQPSVERRLGAHGHQVRPSAAPAAIPSKEALAALTTPVPTEVSRSTLPRMDWSSLKEPPSGPTWQKATRNYPPPPPPSMSRHPLLDVVDRRAPIWDAPTMSELPPSPQRPPSIPPRALIIR